MKVIMIGSDKSILESGSQANLRMARYGEIFEELVIIVRSTGASKTINISKNVRAVSTGSLTKWMFPFDAARQAKRILKGASAGWVISAEDPFECGLSAVWAGEALKVPVQIQIHVDFLSPFFAKDSILNRVRTIIAGYVLPRAASIRVVSLRIKESIEKKYKKISAPIVVLPIFVEPEKFLPIMTASKRTGDAVLNILMVGRLEPEKNYPLAIRAFGNISAKFPNAKLVIVGGGRLDGNLKTLARDLKLERNIVFAGAQGDVAPYYRSATMFLQSSNFECFGMALAEAAYALVPIVTTDVGAVNWLWQDGIGALIASVGDQAAIERGILRLAGSREESERLALNSQAKVKESLPQSWPEYLQRYREAMNLSIKQGQA